MPRRLIEIGAIAVAIAMLAVMAALLSGARGLVLANGQPLFGDFIAFWSAGKLAIAGQTALVHDAQALFAQQQVAAPGVRAFAPWNSPPTFLLIASALATLPYAWSASLFLAASGAFYLYAARKILPDARALVFAVAMPAALYHLGSVQAGLLIAGMTALAITWLDRRPLAAGLLIGVLIIKPHLAVLWPLYLALSGRWRAFLAAAAASLIVTIVAGLVFGFESYTQWIAHLTTAQDRLSELRIASETYASIYGNLRGLGLSESASNAAQHAGQIAAIAVSGYVFLRGGETRVQGAALCAATLLISPYLFFYDAILLGVGAALLGAPRNRLELAASIMAWGAGLSLVIGYAITAPVVPLASALLLATAVKRRAETLAAPKAPAQRM